jgi:hypothetical protein
MEYVKRLESMLCKRKSHSDDIQRHIQSIANYE